MPVGKEWHPASSLYSYCSQNPVHRIDPSGLYDEAGHFYTSYLVAIAYGMSPQDAYTFAYYSQLPDEISKYDAKTAGAGRIGSLGTTLDAATESQLQQARALNAFNKDIEELLHSLHGGLASNRQDCLRKLMEEGKLSPMERGLLAHAMGDSFAHTHYINGSNVAHGGALGHGDPLDGDAGTAPDIIGNNVGNYQRYVRYLYASLGGKDPETNARLRQLLNIANTFNPHDASTPIKALRRLAGFGPGDYMPEGGNNLDANMSVPTQDDIQNLMNKIRCACPPEKPADPNGPIP